MNWRGIEIEFCRKRVRNLNLTVYPDGRVRLSVPQRLPREEIDRFLAGREEWLHRQIQKFGSRPSRREPNFVTGERFPVWGEPRPLRVETRPGAGGVVERDGCLVMSAPPDAGPQERRRLLTEWYRRQLQSRVPAVLARWEPVVGARAAEWHARDMRTRWGSCNVRARRVWLSVRLAAWPPECLDMVTVHELTHLLVPNHSPQFYENLDRFFPEWRRVKQRLGAPPAG